MRDTHSEEQHLSLQCGVHHVGLCDRAALTKPCGNTHGTAARCEERGSGTDGQTVAAPELQQESELMRDNCVCVCVCGSKIGKDRLQKKKGC